MILLIDANVLLAWLADSSELWPAARAALADPGNAALVSAATVWEIEIKRALGKLTAPDGLVEQLEASDFESLPITARDAETAGRLPPIHRDPFDRMLVAQGQRLDAIVVSRDHIFREYEIDVLAP